MMGKEVGIKTIKILAKAPVDVKIAFFVLVFLVLLALSYPLLPYTYFEQNPDESLLVFSPKHPLGTDELGRDMLARVSYGIGVSLRVAILASVVATAIGTAIGMIAGWFGGIVDNIIMRLIDFLIAIPELIIIVLISLFIGRGELSVALAIALVSWLVVARVIRGETMRIKSSEFVLSAIAMGLSIPSILFKHILPNILPAVLTMLVLRIPVAILTESGLSFIGLGLKPPASSLGVLAEQGFRAISFYPHLTVIPAVFILLLVWSSNAVGQWISSRIR